MQMTHNFISLLTPPVTIHESLSGHAQMMFKSCCQIISFNWIQTYLKSLLQAQTPYVITSFPQLGSFSTGITCHGTNPGITIENNLNFNKHVEILVWSCFTHWSRISNIQSFLSPKNVEIVNHAFITPCLDYCNSLYSCLSKHKLSGLQLILNASARLLTNSNERVHITPISASLHWLTCAF